jgi:hypothetical protein
LFAGLILGCGDDDTTAPAGPFLDVTPVFRGIDEGSDLQLAASIAGEPVTVSWATSNPAVITVSATGVVHGVAPGMAAATATLSDGSQQRSASITVNALQGIALANGVTVTGLSGTATSAAKLYRISVPAGSSNLSVVLAGGTGDADLFVRLGTPPTGTAFDCSSEGATTNETCDFADPDAGTWYIRITSFVYSNATLTATVTP